ncbi:MAG: acetate kinase [Burkholderiales bacterium]
MNVTQSFEPRSGNISTLTTLAIALSIIYPASAQQNPAAADIEQVKQLLEQESKKFDELQRGMQELEKKLQSDRKAMQEQKQRLEDLQRRVGVKPPPPPRPQQVQQTPQQTPSQQAQPQAPPDTVGQAPPRQTTRPPEVAPISQQPGVLTAKGKWVLEPSLQYEYSTNNRVAIAGFSILPAFVIGLIDVRSVNRSTWTAAITTRFGITNRLEVEARLPYIYRSDSTVARPFGVPTATDQAFEASGNDIGDVELTGRYQINDGGADKPYFISSLRVKTRTGKSPFEVETFSPFAGSGLLQKELPTGSGFYGVQPSLTVIYPSDPAVFFGTVSYLHNFKRDVGNRFGTIDPGDVISVNFGMGLALNEKASFSLGYDHSIITKLKQNGVVPPATTSAQLGTLLLGYSYRRSPKTTWNLSLGIGVTKDAPDVQLRLRVPISVN